MKLSDSKVEEVFAYAVALEQEGRQKNTVFCYGTTIYILNYDMTLLLRFSLKESEAFKVPVGFFANDYDSSEFEIEGDSIVFIKGTGEFERRKSCKVPGGTFQDADEIFKNFYTDSYVSEVSLDREEMGLLNPSLSHVEFLGRDKRLIIVQRDIFSGSLIKLMKKESGLAYADSETPNFGPLGIRMNDLMALFTVDSSIKLHFLEDEKKYFIAKGLYKNMTAIVSGCLYDTIGDIYIQTKKEEQDGREESKDRSDEPGVDRKAKATSCRKRN